MTVEVIAPLSASQRVTACKAVQPVGLISSVKHVIGRSTVQPILPVTTVLNRNNVGVVAHNIVPVISKDSYRVYTVGIKRTLDQQVVICITDRSPDMRKRKDTRPIAVSPDLAANFDLVVKISAVDLQRSVAEVDIRRH